MTIRIIYVILLIAANPLISQHTLSEEQYQLVYSTDTIKNYTFSNPNIFLDKYERSLGYKTDGNFSIRLETSENRPFYSNNNAIFTTDIQENQKPPMKRIKILAELIAGGVGSIVGFLGGSIAGSNFDYICPNCSDEYTLPTGILIGIPLGTASGVYFVGNLLDEKGFFSYTWYGSVVGFYCGLTLGIALHQIMGDWSGLFLFASPPIGATIGYNILRNYKKVESYGSSFINVKDTRIELSIPTVFAVRNPYSQDINYTFEIFQLRF